MEDRFKVELLKTLASLKKHIDNLEKDRVDFEQRVTQHLEQVMVEHLGKIRKTVEGTEREMEKTKLEMGRYMLGVIKSGRKTVDVMDEYQKATEEHVKAIEDLVQPETISYLSRMAQKIERDMKKKKGKE